MIKKILKTGVFFLVIFALLLGASYLISQSRLHRYSNTVVNSETFSYRKIDAIFEKTNSDTIYVFLYDKDSEDCVYLDEVILKQISYEHNGILFEDIYKVIYENSYRSYIAQMIKNTYQIETFPAIVAIQKKDDTYEKLDSFEYTSDQKKNKKELNAFLERNHFFDISQKD